MRYGLVLALVAALVVLPACAKKSTTVQNSTTVPGANGPITITQDQGSKSVTWQSKEGTTKIGPGAVDPQSLGLPIYPGAQPNGNGSISGETAQGKSAILTMDTTDPFDKVYAFYKDKMPAGSEKSHVSMAGNQMAMFEVPSSADKATKSVTLTGAGNKTNIVLVVGTKI